MYLTRFTTSKNYILIFSLLFTLSYSTKAQLSVNPNQTAAVLSAALAGPGITISSPVLTCAGVANGTFTVTPGTLLGTGTTLFGISKGILLTTGKSTAASGPEPVLASTNNGTAGDPALTTLAGATTYDACILEFDFTTVGDTVKFNYQFGTEEFNHSTCGPYNDAFAFYISGPGITGTQNMALVPGTNIPVTVNSVNSGIPGPGYTLANCTVMGAGSPFTTYFADNTGGANFTYKGFTTKLTAVHDVIPCNTYHLKITIADAGNRIYDSGVFIEGGSLTTPSISGVPAVCAGGTSVLSDPLPGGTWSSSNTSVATVGSASGVVTGISAGTSTISYSFGTGCYVTTTFTVNPLPGAINGTIAICAGATTTLTDALTGGTWSSSNTAVAAINPLTGTVTGTSTGTATITYTLSSGCSTTTVVTINVAPAAITGATTICAGSVLTLSDPTPGGKWKSSAAAVATIDSITGLLTSIAAGTAIISYTNYGCNATTIVTVKTIATSSVNMAICAGQSYSFGGIVYTTTGSYTHTFKTSVCDSIVTLNLAVNPVSASTVNAAICDGQTYTMGSNIYTTTGTYTYRTTNHYGCDSIVTINLVVTPAPPAPAVSSPIVYCVGQTPLQLTATGNNLTWYTSAAGGLGSSVAPIPSTSAAGTTAYYVTQEMNGCQSPQATIQVIIAPIPNADISYSRKILCRRDTISLSTNYADNTSWLWSLPAGAHIVYGTNTNPGPIVVEMDSLGYQQIKLTVNEYGATCTNADSIKVQVIDSPRVAFYTKPDVCIGDTVVVALSSATPGVSNYSWNFGDATLISVTNAVNGGPYNIMWTSSGIHVIEMYGMLGNLCRSREMTDTINVHQLPNAGITALDKTDICMGDSLWFSAAAYALENKYEWAPEHFFNNLNEPGIYGRIELPGYVTLTVTDPFGCVGINEVYINAKSCCNVAFPNAFTPNGDGKNDIFRPITAGHHQLHVFRVANRWGQIVYETVNERDGWNGSFNGVPQDIGVYYYYIKYDCNGQTIEEKGDVTLIR